MEFKVKLPIKKGDEIYVIIDSKIEKLYVTEVRQLDKAVGLIIDDYMLFEQILIIEADRYKEPENSCTFVRRLADCFLSREELINQL